MSVTICSIYPLEVRAERPFFQPSSKFNLPAVQKGADPYLFVLEDHYEIGRAAVTGKITQNRIDAIALADDLIGEWTSRAPGMNPECHPGIFRCAGPKPTAAELEHFRKIQYDWLVTLVQQGDFMHQQKPPREPTDGMRTACRYLGLEREWLYSLKDAEVQKCPYCGNAVAAGIIKCSHCGEIINVEKYAEMEAKREGAVAAAKLAAQKQQPSLAR